ncbi:uncharacterized protein LOC143292881 [Babylonia areolata]|uniref:uncharacterized protein LOC143292881 n=1 Tax=Babylonia areolata TaxID=304850 RepID=UPI003FD444CB
MANDNSSDSPVRKRMNGLFFVVCCCCVWADKVYPVKGQTLPTFNGCPSPLLVKEDTEVGQTLFSIQARVNVDAFPANNLTFTLESGTSELVNLTQPVFLNDSNPTGSWACDVVLGASLDRDFEPSRRALSFGATDTKGNTAVTICYMNIEDVNDNDPSFQGLPFDIEVNEMTDVGTILRSGISASDPDFGVGGQVFLQAEYSDYSVEQTFNTTVAVQGSGQVMDIILAQPLDYESRTFYTFNVRAVDGGGRNTSVAVRVTVTDAQDTPPVFLLDTYRAAIREHQPLGSPVITVSAVDGDRDPSNDIIYSIVQGRRDYFAIHNQTGSITSLLELDRDNVTMMDTDGVFHLTVRATETDDVHPQHGNTTTEVEVVVVVEDINDHPPTFSSLSPYTAFVREDSPQGSLIYFEGDGYISVSDRDQGRNSHFNLTVERDGVPWPVLEAAPSTVYTEALVLLRVTERDAFKAFAGTHLSLQLVAREVSTAERRSSTAEVILTVQRLPEPTTTPAPLRDDDSITAPDIVVFVIGFLVIFNVVATCIIVWFVRRQGKATGLPQQGLTRRGSKYYVHGVERESRGSSGVLQNGSAVSLRSESVQVEVDGKDRCDVAPFNTVLASNRSSDPVFTTSTTSGSTTNSPVNGHVGSGGGGHDSTDRKVLINNEVSPARTVTASIESIGTSLGSSKSASAVSFAGKDDDLPSFSKAKRNVTSQQNPAFSLSVPNLSSAPDAATSQRAASSASPAAVAAAAYTAVTKPSASSSTQSVPLDKVTRFGAEGSVSTTTTVAQPATASASASDSVSSSTASGLNKGGSTQRATANHDGENGSMVEVLY